MKVLVVGASQDLTETLRVILSVRWHDITVLHTQDWGDSLAAVRREEPMLVLIDHSSEIAKTCDFISQLRSFSDVPVVVVGEEEDVTAEVRALETGADDWIPASSIPMEFIARVHALVRRCHGEHGCPLAPYCNGTLCIDFARQEVRIDGRRLSLTPTEFKVLCHLAKHEGSVVTREALLATVWGSESYADPEFVKKYIHRLRVKLEDDPAEPTIIVNRRGVGYMLATAPPNN